jgi:hypothetical protein
MCRREGKVLTWNFNSERKGAQDYVCCLEHDVCGEVERMSKNAKK